MLKKLYRSSTAPARRAARPRTAAPAPRGAARPLARQSGRRDVRCRAAGSTRRARRRRPGTSSSISPAPGSTTTSATCFGIFPANDPALVDAVIAALGAPPDFPIGGRTLRDVLTDGVSLSPAPDMLFQLISLSDRRRPAQDRQRRWRPGRIRTAMPPTLDVLAALQKFRGVRPDPEAFIEALDPLQPRVYSISSSPKMQSRPRLAHRRRRALPDRRAHAPWCRLDVPCRPHRARRKAQGLRAEGAALRAAGRSDEADHHDRPRHRHRAVPRLPAGASWPPRRPAATGCSSATSAAITTSSTRTSSGMRTRASSPA